jgi:hypothetical protein
MDIQKPAVDQCRAYSACGIHIGLRILSSKSGLVVFAISAMIPLTTRNCGDRHDNRKSPLRLCASA